MAYRAAHRYARISARKARLVADLIREMDAAEALVQLQLSKQRAASFYKTVLESAIANAEEDAADLAELYVSEAFVNEGPAIKRWRPKDRGRAHPYRKHVSHLHLTLEERNGNTRN